MKLTTVCFASLLALSMSAANAFACPNISGSWTCTDSSGQTSTTTIVDTAITGGMQYSITADNSTMAVNADGTAHPVSQNGWTGTMTATCASDTGINFTENLAAAHHSVTVAVTGYVTLSNATTYVDSAQAVITQSGQAPQTMASSSTCKHQ